MFRSIAIRGVVALAVIAAVSCCSSVLRAETLSPTFQGANDRAGLGTIGAFGAALPAAPTPPISPALIRSITSEDRAVAYHCGLAKPSFGSDVAQDPSRMGFGFETVPFESFLSAAAAPGGENRVRTFIIIESAKSQADETPFGTSAGDDIVTRFTQASTGSTTTSGSATLSILQVPPASSSLVFTTVLMKDDKQAIE